MTFLTVSSSSESESEVEQKRSRKSPSTEQEVRTVNLVTFVRFINEIQSEQSTPGPAPKPTKKEKKKSKSTLTSTTNGDTPMRDASLESSPAPTPALVPKTKAASGKEEEEFDSIYIRKITTELADDLDKVREAQDFKANSIPMLIHALKQGESLFSVEEKRRVVGTAKA